MYRTLRIGGSCKVYNTPAVKPTPVRRKPVSKNASSVRRKPIASQNADATTSPVSPSSFPGSLTTLDSQAQQAESTSTTPEDKMFERTNESTIEFSGVQLNCDHLKHPSHPYFSQFSDLSAPKPSNPQMAETDKDILEYVQPIPVQLAPVQSFIPEDIDDMKRRRRKSIRNGVVLYITLIS